MLDLIVAARIARHFHTRAEERGKSGKKVARTVLLVILGAEAAGIVSLGLLSDWDGNALVVGGLFGLLVGVIAAYSVGGSMTTGPIIRRADEPRVAGRECYECQQVIVADTDGRQCKRCRHAIHTRCRKEHRIAHREYEAKTSARGPGTAPPGRALPHS